MTDLPSLITRLEQATGPSRELDADIVAAVYPEIDTLSGDEAFGEDPQWWQDGNWCPMPPFTASLDAELDGPLGETEQGAPSPTLALCIASLRARHAETQKDNP